MVDQLMVEAASWDRRVAYWSSTHTLPLVTHHHHHHRRPRESAAATLEPHLDHYLVL